MIPQLNTYGLFTALAPFTLQTVNYKVSQLQTFDSLVKEGVNIFNTYYTPNGLTNTNYETDYNNGEVIVTLTSTESPTVSIPSSYLNNAPIEVAVQYNRMVISIDLGNLPEMVNVDALLPELQNLATDWVGQTATMRLHQIPLIGDVSYSQYLNKEAVRIAAINKQPTFYTAMIAADTQLQAAREKIANLEAALIAANTIIQNAHL